METNQLELHVESRELISKNESGDKFTTSLIIAEATGKQHKHVLADIKKIIDNDEIDEPNFRPIFYSDSYSREKPAYQVSRDGFTYLMARYTGKKARKFLKQLSVEFNRREEIIKEKDAVITEKNAEILARDLMLYYQQRTFLLEADLEGKNKEIAIKEEVIKIQEPDVKYAKKMQSSISEINTTSIAKELGMSANRLNDLLHSQKIQYKIKNQWFLYADYDGEEYMATASEPIELKDGRVITPKTSKWTEKGRRFILELVYDLRRKLEDAGPAKL